jgi:hypothetical protein
MRFGAGLTALAVLAAVSACKPPAAAVKPASSAPANAVPASAAAGPASGPDADAAKAFLEGLYAHYRTDKDNSFQMFDKDETAVFDPDTIRLLAADTKALKGELGEIDGDWLCNCQDFTSLAATITVQSASPTTAQASADFHDTGDPTRPPDHDSFELVKTGGVWRIHDIATRGDPLSLRATLLKEISDLAHGGGAVSGPANAGDEAP